MIYIHIPYCHRKCTYCAFYSAVTKADKQGYVDALCEELRRRRHEQAHPIRTVYFGGGTPSLLSVGQIGQIAGALRDNYDLGGVEEVTLESNPEDLTPQFLDELRRLGFVNRLSIGVQSFHDSDLRLLNRRHSAAEAFLAVKNASAAGFDNITLDLIYGLPGQSLALWQENLSMLEPLPIRHLSAYALTVEEGTMLARQIDEKRVEPLSEEGQLEHYFYLLQWARAHGFEQYEISNFSQPGFRSRHNSRYWDRTPYLGAGAGAHSFDGARRRWNVADVHDYIASVSRGPVAHEEEEIGLKEAHNEYLMTALRTVEGIDKRLVAAPFSARLAGAMQRYIDAGLILDTPTHYRPSDEGLLHADGIASELFV